MHEIQEDIIPDDNERINNSVGLKKFLLKMITKEAELLMS